MALLTELEEFKGKILSINISLLAELADIRPERLNDCTQTIAINDSMKK
jgi:flagellar biosynthesis regulator FlaF